MKKCTLGKKQSRSLSSRPRLHGDELVIQSCSRQERDDLSSWFARSLIIIMAGGIGSDRDARLLIDFHDCTAPVLATRSGGLPTR